MKARYTHKTAALHMMEERQQTTYDQTINLI